MIAFNVATINQISTIQLPIAFPNIYRVFCNYESTIEIRSPEANPRVFRASNSKFDVIWHNSVNTIGGAWFAIGY